MKIRKPSRLFTGCVIFPPAACFLCYLVGFAAVSLPYYSSYNKWQAAKPQNYSVSVSGTFFGYRQEETVRNGIIISSTVTNPTKPLIEVMFDSVERCIFKLFGFLTCEVTYDPTYGYPQRLVVVNLDLGWTYEVSQFIPES
jgi:hypothetical protein